MRILLAALVLPLLACVDEPAREVVDAADDASDARQDADTGGVTCGKCVRLWHTESVDVGGYLHPCAVEDATGLQCCPTLGDTGCPSAPDGYEWRICADVREAFGKGEKLLREVL